MEQGEYDKADVVKIGAGGQAVLNFNPSTACPDSEDVGETWGTDNPQIGFSSSERAKARGEEKFSRFAAEYNYHEATPCAFCANCIILREMREGRLCNIAYFCKDLRRKVSKIGTCQRGRMSKMGPMIIKKDLVVEEALSAESKAKLVN